LEDFPGKEDPLNRNYAPICNLFTPNNRPDDVASQFDEIAPPPNLIALDEFTDDGAPSQLEKYSDPDFFFREWAKAEEARNQRENEMKKMRKRKRKERKMNEKARQAKQQAYGQMSSSTNVSRGTSQNNRGASPRRQAPSKPKPQPISPVSPKRRPAPRKPAPRQQEQVTPQISDYDTDLNSSRRAPPKPTGRRAPPKPTSRRPPPRPTRSQGSGDSMGSQQISDQSSDDEDEAGDQDKYEDEDSPDVRQPPPRSSSGSSRRPPPTRRAPPQRRPAPRREPTPPPTPEPTIPDGMCYAKDHPQYAKHFRNLEKNLLPIPAIKRAMAQNGLDPNVLDDPMAIIPDGEVQVRRKAAGGMRAALMAQMGKLAKAPPKAKSKAKKTMSLLEQLRSKKARKLRKVDREKIKRDRAKEEEEKQKKEGKSTIASILRNRRAAIEDDDDDEDDDNWGDDSEEEDW